MLQSLVTRHYIAVTQVTAMYKHKLVYTTQMLQLLVHDIYIAVTQVTAMYKHKYILVVTYI